MVRSLSDIKPNKSNPRTIKAARVGKLREYLSEYGDLSGLVYNSNPECEMIVSGHQRTNEFKKQKGKLKISERYDSAQEDGTVARGFIELENGQRYVYREVNWPKEKAASATIIANGQFGEWDSDVIANEWTFEREELADMGVPEFVFGGGEEQKEEKTVGKSKGGSAWVPDCLFPSNNVYEVPTLDINHQAEEVTSPVILWGSEGRTKKIPGGTVLFYVDDYRFSAIWDDPLQIADTYCGAVVEPNLSIYDTMPVSYALHLIYKKRWIARYLQTLGIKTFVDLNVSVKFAEYNLLGVPDGWNAFSTRGYVDRIEYLEHEIETAKRVSGKENPFMIVYGGGKKIMDVVAKNNLVYIEQFRGFGQNI